MRIVLNFLLVTTFLLTATAISFAGSRSVNAREHREQQRINQGIRSGELTRREARRLESGLARIRIDERFARADGHFTPRERARMQHELDRESRNIYRQKHDGQDRIP
jgi:Spy/CpxP family protein refolding chaperone